MNGPQGMQLHEEPEDGRGGAGRHLGQGQCCHFLAFFIVSHNLAALIQVAISVCLTLNAIEFVCFVVIFVELYKHHKRHVQLCLANKPNTASSKEKR